MSQTRAPEHVLHSWLVVLAAASCYYLYRALDYRFLEPGMLGPSLLNKKVWYVGHVLFALPVLLGGPLQFVPQLRRKAPHIHRAIGNAYVVGASASAILALYLGATIQYEGSRLPIVIAASLWLLFTLAAWRSAVRKRLTAHRAFMIRSYTMALVLVWLRLMYDLQDYLFFYVVDVEMRDATREWASWVVPLLLVELWLSWLPQARGRPTA